MDELSPYFRERIWDDFNDCQIYHEAYELRQRGWIREPVEYTPLVKTAEGWRVDYSLV